jgi:hypothetical protein
MHASDLQAQYISPQIQKYYFRDNRAFPVAIKIIALIYKFRTANQAGDIIARSTVGNLAVAQTG